MAETLPKLQQVLGGRFRVERELGRGGMAVVYLAHDIKHDRPVALKVLKPVLARVVAHARFLREIEILARLNHPRILALYDSGAEGEILYYVMPVVEGESLRDRMDRQGQLSIDKAIAVLLGVSEGVGYAHERGVIHRDLKPGNILFQHEHPLIADFGIAHAAHVSHRQSEGSRDTLTEEGISLGTPAYMAPEQAAADPAVDHRADLYAIGCIAYELLTGQPPFVRPTPQQVLAAQIIDTPRHVAELRSDTPDDLSDLIMSCLEKAPEDRPQSATEIENQLRKVATASASEPLTRRALAQERRSLGLGLGFYLLAVVLVVSGSWWAMHSLGLPDWVVPASLLVMAPGLPLVMLAAHADKRRVGHAGHPVVANTGFERILRSLHLQVTWQRTALGGFVAIALFVVGVAGYMMLRARGIGPMATLISSGTLRPHERLVLADFIVRGADSTLGTTLTGATRAALEQSSAISLLSDAQVSATLKRMKRERPREIEPGIAREIAEREGARAIVQGDLASVGGKSMLALRLIDAGSGSALATFSADVSDNRELVPTIDKLSRRMRASIGESLKNVRASPPLERVTTSSLEALRKYTAGVYANGVEQDWPKAMQLLDEAIALDTGFALAWRALGAAGANGGRGHVFVDSAVSKAFEHSDRLPESEREIVAGMHYSAPLVGPGLDFDVPWRRFGFGRDRAKAARSYESVTERDSAQVQYTLSLGLIYQSRRDFRRAESLYRALLAKAPASPLAQMHLFESVFAQGKWMAADTVMRLTQQMFPESPVAATTAGTMLYWRGDLSRFGQFLEAGISGPPTVRRLALVAIADFSLMQGKLSDFQKYRQYAADMGAMFGLVSPVVDSVLMAIIDAEFRSKPVDAVRRLNAALRLGASLPPADREYISIAEGFARAGKPARARAILQLHQKLLPDTVLRRSERPLVDQVAGEIALAEGRPRDAMAYFRRSDLIPDGPVTDCTPCLPLNLARSYDAANVSDSAIILFETYLNTPHSTRGWEVKLDPLNLGHVYERLAQLYELKNDNKKAVDYYRKFIDLWKNADAELKPRVITAQRQLSRLQQGVSESTI